MIRRPPRSTPLSLHDALPISYHRKNHQPRQIIAPTWTLLGLNSLNPRSVQRSEEHTSELQSRLHLVCRLLLEKKNNKYWNRETFTRPKTRTRTCRCNNRMPRS